MAKVRAHIHLTLYTIYLNLLGLRYKLTADPSHKAAFDAALNRYVQLLWATGPWKDKEDSQP